MAREIERKYLITSDEWTHWQPLRVKMVKQGYLLNTPEKVVRVRYVEGNGFITVKIGTSALSRLEYEYSVPGDDALEMLDHCDAVLLKTRTVLEYHGWVWEVDQFHGLNEGLVVAEIELPSEDQVFDVPSWVGREVTEDFRYTNNNLITTKAPQS